MKILFGVQGTGNGHISRARIMAKAFALRSDVEVDFVFSGREQTKYFDMQVFADFKTYQGLSFVSHKGAIDYWQTFKSLQLGQFIKDVRHLDLSPYDLVLNDFEPVTAWAAKKQNVPAISISHQAAFYHPIPIKGVSYFDRLLTRNFAPTDVQLGIHWYHFGFPIMPPFIVEEHIDNNVDKSILVYLPFEDINEIQQTLAIFSEHDFVCFHPAISSAYTKENIVWQPTAKIPFKNALAKCQGVIANAGFEMASECLHYSKSMLLKPLAGQFEQLSNALTLADLGLCQLMRTLDAEAIEQWLQSASGATVKFPSNPNILIDWLLKKEWSDTQSLCTSLWKQVNFPPTVQSMLRQLPN